MLEDHSTVPMSMLPEGDSLACSGLIKFRRQHPLLGQKDFLSPQDITWHEDNWDNPESKFLAFSLHDRCQSPFRIHCFPVHCSLLLYSLCS